MKKQTFRLLLLIASILLLTACQNEEPTAQEANPIEENNVLVLAVLPYDVPTKIQRHFAPLLTFLSKSLNRPVKLYVATSYEEQILKIVRGQVDLAYLGPSSFVRAYDRFESAKGNKIQPIATEIPYEAAIVVRKDSPIKNISDLKNHTIAFGAYQSFAGHFKIRDSLKKNGVSLSDLKLYSFLGRHERAIMSVVYGEFDAAAASSGIVRRIKGLNYSIKTIYSTDELPPIMIAASPYMPKEWVSKLKNSFLNPSFEGQEAITMFAPGGTFLPFNNQAYEPVRQIMKIYEQ
ncbi:phosphate/phosphite/phosphonate ABC transporter substrate-binding protein [Thiomicrorhabdus sp. Milos-T2]|uniref:phosphate/phosphite/phosphonate ABC transporter substrate-binding protein n=1 Tax=Thiomicrorhabdus sp. Milos-T2 TaxID=90814 RepID=UPI00068ED066|nr:phosphate/phosphite/phosphonate ABC transporter substrate-binding protein [Thiomicrorhabdus sp. Milos-T2]